MRRASSEAPARPNARAAGVATRRARAPDEFRRNPFHRRWFSLGHLIVARVARTLGMASAAHQYGWVPCPATGTRARGA
jgi:hypothetical protein